jgi:hypothetical protein
MGVMESTFKQFFFKQAENQHDKDGTHEISVKINEIFVEISNYITKL